MSSSSGVVFLRESRVMRAARLFGAGSRAKQLWASMNRCLAAIVVHHISSRLLREPKPTRSRRAARVTPTRLT